MSKETHVNAGLQTGPIWVSTAIQGLSPVLPHLVSLCVALFGGLWLFHSTVSSNLTSTILDFGLDPQRTQLVSALLLTTGAAFIGAIIGRRKLTVMIGAGTVFCVNYLMGFVQLELQPVRDPGGNLEALNIEVLIHTSFVMLALALLCAFIGSAVGRGFGEVLLAPPYRFVEFLWQRRRPVSSQRTLPLLRKETTRGRTTSIIPSRNTLGSWFATATMTILVILASSASDLFIFSPDTGLHALPSLTSIERGTIVHDEVISPALGGQQKPFLVYLPPSYNTPAGRTKRYPTLYLLHGSPGHDNDWLTGGKADQSADTLIARGKMPELILILPDGNGRSGETSEWGNSFDHKQNIETYIAVDLVKYVDQKYRTIASPIHRGIGGLSMGGFGAMNIAIHHPAVFGIVIALGGYYRAEGSIWSNNAAYIRNNSPLEVLPTDKPAWKLHMYIGAATKDQPYYDDALQFVHELNRWHIPYRLDIQNGFHSWQVWQVQMYNAFIWLGTQS
jgi:S-formylglutathione hydrolase FrmB